MHLFCLKLNQISDPQRIFHFNSKNAMKQVYYNVDNILNHYFLLNQDTQYKHNFAFFFKIVFPLKLPYLEVLSFNLIKFFVRFLSLNPKLHHQQSIQQQNDLFYNSLF